jgi:hypothetical protein
MPYRSSKSATGSPGEATMTDPITPGGEWTPPELVDAPFTRETAIEAYERNLVGDPEEGPAEDLRFTLGGG